VSGVIILYGGLAIAMLRGALIQEMVAQRASRRRLERELHRAVTRMLATVPPQTVSAQTPDSTASMQAGRPRDSGSATMTSVRRTRRTR
jgi:hypothetical protein